MEIERRQISVFYPTTVRACREMACFAVNSLIGYGYSCDGRAEADFALTLFIDKVRRQSDAQALIMGCYPRSVLSVAVLLGDKSNGRREESFFCDLVDLVKKLPHRFTPSQVVLDEYSYVDENGLLRQVERVYPLDQFAKVIVGFMEEPRDKIVERLLKEVNLRPNNFGKIT